MAKARAASSDASEKEALQALEKISRIASRAPATRAAVDIKSLCKVYNQIKPLLEKVLPFIEKIPVYGKKIADAIRLLMQIADVACAFG